MFEAKNYWRDMYYDLLKRVDAGLAQTEHDEIRQLRLDNARLRDEAFLRTRDHAQTTQEQLVEAGKAAIVIRNELDRVRADRDYHADLAERWKAQFDSAAAAASEYSEFWEKNCRDFDQFGNYVPYSQMDGDLRAAKRRIAELEAALSDTSPEGKS